MLNNLDNIKFSENIRFGDPLFGGNELFYNNEILNLNEILSIKRIPSYDASIYDHLNFIETHIPQELISKKNYLKIKNLAKNFSGGISSFYGFESRLNSREPDSDYLFAVSSKNGERERLKYLLDNLKGEVFEHTEWKNIKRFVDLWANPKSDLYKNILGLWFEFDTSINDEINQMPSIFFQTKFEKKNNLKVFQDNKWIIKQAIPLLTGHKVKNNTEKKFIEILKKLPDQASIFHVACMLSRNINDIRVVINKISPNEIIPYLKSIGWEKNDNGLENLIGIINKYSNCIRLHVGINEHLNKKIGLECFISPGKYHNLNEWKEFLDFLEKKGWCETSLKDPLINFTGVDIEDKFADFNFENYIPTVKLSDSYLQKALVRYISHVKIIYEPNNKVQVKAYTGVRLFGKKSNIL